MRSWGDVQERAASRFPGRTRRPQTARRLSDLAEQPTGLRSPADPLQDELHRPAHTGARRAGTGDLARVPKQLTEGPDYPPKSHQEWSAGWILRRNHTDQEGADMRLERTEKKSAD